MLLFYSKAEDRKFSTIFTPLPQSTVDNWYRYEEPGTGRRYNKADVTGPGGAAKGNPHYEWKGVTRYWRYKRETMEALDAAGRLVYSKSPGMPYRSDTWTRAKASRFRIGGATFPCSRLRGKGERLGYPTQNPRLCLSASSQRAPTKATLSLTRFAAVGQPLALHSGLVAMDRH